MSPYPGRLLVATACLVAAASAAADPLASPLTLSEAEALARSRDAGLAALHASAGAWWEEAVAARQLPDPELRVGIENLPLDSLSRHEEPMTMASVGVMQRFPPPGERSARGAAGAARAGEEEARAAQRALSTTRMVREAYVDLAEKLAEATLIAQAGAAARTAEALARADYAGGGDGQQGVLEAGIAALRLDDRIAAVQGAVGERRAGLARWLGAHAQRPLPPGLPADAELPARGTAGVPAAHPELAALDAAVAQARAEVALARAAYRPAFALEGGYGERAARDPRGREVPDVATVMLTVSLPLWPGQRQDRRLAAAQQRLAAARHARTDGERMLAAQLEAARARAAQLAQRIALYDRELLPRAATLVRSARAGLEAGTGSPRDPARAELARLELALERLALAADALRTRAEIAYLEGR